MKKIILISSMTMLLVMLLTACSDKSTTDDMASDADTDNDTSTSNTNSGDNEDGDNTKDTTDGVDDTSTDAASDLETTDETVADETTDDTTASTDEADQTEATQVVYDFEDQFMMPASGEEVVVLHTNFGEIKLRLFPEVAPLAVENFLTHVKDGYYDGLTFHRVMADFMIQGGDPNGDGSGGESIYEGPFADEFTIEYLPYRGALCMANSGANTNGSQF
ncbi:MAG: peptidylprolyl isomerase, partial [Vallitaleaceae bacterium]|nr:peptidylprolyl isomerase [Vallitaleaceae bacterium]